MHCIGWRDHGGWCPSFALELLAVFLPYGTMVWLKCVCHIRKTRSVIVPWTHIQPCPGHIYNCALDTFYKRVVDTFQALTRFSNHSVEETCEDFGNYICGGN